MLNNKQIIETITGLLEFVKSFFYVIPTEVYILSIFIVLLIFILLFNNQRKRAKILRNQIDVLESIFRKLDLSRGVETVISSLLVAFSSQVTAEGYYFYIRDDKSEQLMLKVVRHKDEAASHLSDVQSNRRIPVNKEVYSPPLILPPEAQPSSVMLVKHGQVPMLAIPIEGGKGLINIGPTKDLSAQNKEVFSIASRVLKPILDIICNMESMKNKLDIQTASSRAVYSFTTAARGFLGSCRMLLNLTTMMIGATGGCFLASTDFLKDDLDRSEENDKVMLRFSTEEHSLVSGLLGEEVLRALTRKDKDFFSLPLFIKNQDAELAIVVNIPARYNNGVAVFWYNELPQGEYYRFTGLHLMIKRLADLLDSHNKYKELSKSYEDMLKTLVQTIDNLEPYTVGYSNLMAQYAGIIAREMNLEKEVVEDVVLAAELSNIGVLGFSNELLFKPEATIANTRVADYIKYHHERVDGYGYPQGLEGAQIPVGAKIIAVVQTFLAKINGRRYREPLSFEKAIELLRSASGTQLDPTAVSALINWFKKKQANPKVRGHSLGRCWEIRCAPITICQDCPAYGIRDQNCWEIEGVHCEAHGNTCTSCFVYTEYLYRMGPKF
jgi:HD-GYP domain-containing protein (c-di-GMP phosphodiesterase class II)